MRRLGGSLALPKTLPFRKGRRQESPPTNRKEGGGLLLPLWIDDSGAAAEIEEGAEGEHGVEAAGEVEVD